MKKFDSNYYKQSLYNKFNRNHKCAQKKNNKRKISITNNSHYIDNKEMKAFRNLNNNDKVKSDNQSL